MNCSVSRACTSSMWPPARTAACCSRSSPTTSSLAALTAGWSRSATAAESSCCTTLRASDGRCGCDGASGSGGVPNRHVFVGPGPRSSPTPRPAPSSLPGRRRGRSTRCGTTTPPCPDRPASRRRAGHLLVGNQGRRPDQDRRARPAQGHQDHRRGRVRPRLLQSVERAFLTGLREQVKSGEFAPLPVRERMIPKRSGKLRGLGIPTAADRVVQASLKLVLEPIFEADFHPCSYGFRPKRRAHDAIAEIHMLGSNAYEWVLDADISACFDEISHPALLARVRRRIADKRVLGLVKAFLKAGVLSEQGITRDTKTGTPQGGSATRWRTL